MLGAERGQPLVPQCCPFLGGQDGVPPWGAEGKNPPENRDMREVALISLKQPFGKFKAGASPGMGVSGLSLCSSCDLAWLNLFLALPPWQGVGADLLQLGVHRWSG